jgi:hypothetical protein
LRQRVYYGKPHPKCHQECGFVGQNYIDRCRGCSYRPEPKEKAPGKASAIGEWRQEFFNTLKAMQKAMEEKGRRG